MEKIFDDFFFIFVPRKKHRSRFLKNIISILFILFALGLKPDKASPEPDTSSGICNFIKCDSVLSLCSGKGYVPSLFHNFGEQFTSPLKMRGKDALWLVGVASVTALLIHYDYEIDESIRHTKEKSDLVRVSSPVVTEFGNQYGLGVIGACGLVGLISKDRKLFQSSLLASQAAITSGVWVRLVKYCTSRERPSASYTAFANKGHTGGHWYGFFKQYDESLTSIGRDITFFDAFPSGHTSTAFAIATVFALQYQDVTAVPILAYSLAGLVGITRMIEHTHWASDVFVGAWAGYLCAKQTLHHHKKLFKGDSLYGYLRRKKNADVYLTAADQFAGLKLKVVY